MSLVQRIISIFLYGNAVHKQVNHNLHIAMYLFDFNLLSRFTDAYNLLCYACHTEVLLT